MEICPRDFKRRALDALKGNWQTALLVSFFAAILATVCNLAQPRVVVEVSGTTPEAFALAMEKAEQALLAMPQGRWILLGILYVLNFFITPALTMGCNHYFVSRLEGEELGFSGLFSRMNIWGKALLLDLYVGIKVLAWSLLFIVPGIIAAIRYSMAGYFMAEDPSISPIEAVRRSKEVMQTNEWLYVKLELSFLGWMIMPLLLQLILWDANIIFALVVYQAMLLFVHTYMNGAIAAFFISRREEVKLDMVWHPMMDAPWKENEEETRNF